MSYARFAPMIEDAARYPSLWRLGLGLATVVLVTFAWLSVFGLAAALMMSSPVGDAATRVLANATDTPGGTVIFLLLIVGIGLGAIVAARIWQKRRAGMLFGPAARTIGHFLIGAGAAFGVMALLALVVLPFVELPMSNLDFSVWLIWLPLGVVALAAQTGAEEVLFRGYLQSQVAARFGRAVIWLTVPAVIFGAIHYLPGMPQNQMLALLLIATLFGFLAGDLTARTGSIGAAWGFHFANNAFVVLLVAPDTSLTGLGLYRSSPDFGEIGLLSPLILVEVLTLVAIWALIRRLLSA